MILLLSIILLFISFEVLSSFLAPICSKVGIALTGITNVINVCNG